MKYPFLICGLILAIIGCSCSGRNSDPVEKKNQADSLAVSLQKFDDKIAKGEVVPVLKCRYDSSLSYALYLPKKYSVNDKLPVILLFDSHGSGVLPVGKYKELAEQYGYILAGSNNSKNGLGWEQNEPQIKTFMADVRSKINVDGRRVYACGFSGGSRVASSVAIFDGGIAGVIGMGAGFPSISEPIHNKFDYIGFAGNEDFNMNEMAELDSSMNRSPLRHQLIIFNGKHEWAPADVAENAFVWCEVNAMKDGFISKNDSLLKNFLTKSTEEMKKLSDKKRAFNEYLLCKKMVNMLEGLADVSQFKKRADELRKSAELKIEIEKKEKLAKEEMIQQENYRNNIVLKDLTWWKSEIQKMRVQTNYHSDEERAMMTKRVLNYLSLAVYMNVTSAIQSRQTEQAASLLELYALVDPENSEHQYLFAELYAGKKENAKALASLKNAVRLGFNDLARMQSDSALAVLKNSPDYKKLIEQLESKK